MEMWFRGNVALLLFLTCVFTAEGAKAAGSKGKKQESRGDGSTAVSKGRFTTRDNAQCSWVARGEDTHTLTVTCKPGKGDAFTCRYTARPASCPEYASKPKTYWKQIGRALKKQKKVCADPRSMLRAGMCKGAPQDAHFRLTEPTHAKSPKTEKTPRTDPKTPRTDSETPRKDPETPRKEPETPRTDPKMPTDAPMRRCAGRSDHSQLAREKCGDSWASLCTFLFTVVQNGDC